MRLPRYVTWRIPVGGAALVTVISLLLVAGATGAPAVPAPAAPAAVVGVDVCVRFEPVGTYNIVEAPAEAIEKQTPVEVPLRIAVSGTADKPQTLKGRLWAEDLFGARTGWTYAFSKDLPADARTRLIDIPLKVVPGFYRVVGEFEAATMKAVRRTEIGIVPAPRPGLRPESFFGSNTSSIRVGDELRLLRLVGMRVQRTHFQPRLAAKPPEKPTGEPLALNFEEQDRRLAESKEVGLWVLPIVGYSFEGANSPMGLALGMHGPPRDYREFVSTWEQILRHYPDVTTYEVWNEPWIFGWSWAAPPREFAKLQKMWCDMALKVNPKLRILTGNSSMFAEDNVEPYPECWKGLVSGVTHHPYSGAGVRTMREGGQARSIDHGYVVSRRMGLPYYYLTEGGTEWREGKMPDDARQRLGDIDRQAKAVENLEARLADRCREADEAAQRIADPAVPEEEKVPLRKKATQLAAEIEKTRTTIAEQEEKISPLLFERGAILSQYADPSNNNVNALKIVQYAVRSALSGAYQTNIQWEIGYGPAWTRPNVTLAVLANFIEDRPPVADIWPENELVFGAVFAHPRHITDAVKALPRAGDISVRWTVPVPPERDADKTKVAVVWSNTGKSNHELDAKGTLTMDSAKGLRAYDCTGRPIATSWGKLTVPFNEYPVYLVTDDLDVATFRERIAAGRIEGVTPVNLYALSLTEPADRPQLLDVRIENQLNRPVTGTLTLQAGSKSKPVSTSFVIESAKLAQVPVAWAPQEPSLRNEYGVTLTVQTDAGTVTRRQVVAAAIFAKNTITVDGAMDDWGGVVPVLLDSERLKTGIDLAQYLLNPHAARPDAEAGGKRIIARVYTAYDDANVYLAAQVSEEELVCPAGEEIVKPSRTGGPPVKLPYQNAMPDGLNHIRYAGDALMFAFGFRDRVPGWGRQMGDPYAWKGHFYDTDYLYVAHISKEGDRLLRQWGADTPRRTAYQCVLPPGYGPVPGAKIVIKRDEPAKITTYEMSIPRKELALFNPDDGRLRFGFILCNNEKLGLQGGLQWSEACGVFDHWLSAGSFAPSWCSMLPCQTFFGIEK